MSLPIFEDCTDCLLDICERFLFGVALSHDLGQRRDEHGKTAAFLRLQDDGITLAAMIWLPRFMGIELEIVSNQDARLSA